VILRMKSILTERRIITQQLRRAARDTADDGGTA
jgi:hypothetical protein